MALGENMKIDRLIPEHKISGEESQPEQNIVLPQAIKKEGSLISETVNNPPDETNLNTPQYLDTIDNKSIRAVFTPSRRKATRRIRVLIEGAFTINNSEIIKSRLIEIFNNYDFVDIMLRNIKQIDLTALQIIYVFKNIYQPQNKTISFDIELSKDDNAMIFKGGFADLFLKQAPTE